MTDEMTTFVENNVQLVADIRSILSVHIDNRADVPKILHMVLLAIRTHRD